MGTCGLSLKCFHHITFQAEGEPGDGLNCNTLIYDVKLYMGADEMCSTALRNLKTLLYSFLSSARFNNFIWVCRLNVIVLS